LRRRDFVTLLGGAVTAWPLSADAQQEKPAIIGILSPARSDGQSQFAAFRAKLRALGHVQGRTVNLEFRLTAGRLEATSVLAADLVKAAPDVIIGDGVASVRALRSLTTTIPIVGILGPDPVAGGLVPSLSNPKGNITGVTTLGNDLHPKRIELLKEAVPRVSRLAVLWDRGNDPREVMLNALSQYAAQLKLPIDLIEGGKPEAFAALTPDRLREDDALMVSSGPIHFAYGAEIVERIAAVGKPAVYPESDYAEIGGLMSYGPNIANVFRRLAEMADRILKGAKVSDIPIEQVSRLEFVVNMKTARALGLAIPSSILSRADIVLE